MFDFKIFKSCIAKEESLRKMKKDEKKKEQVHIWSLQITNELTKLILCQPNKLILFMVPQETL